MQDKVGCDRSVLNRMYDSSANTDQNFVLKVYIVITSKVFADFRFESPISIDFQSEILALLPPKSAKVFADSRGKSLQTLEVIIIQILCPIIRRLDSSVSVSSIRQHQ